MGSEMCIRDRYNIHHVYDKLKTMGFARASSYARADNKTRCGNATRDREWRYADLNEMYDGVVRPGGIEPPFAP